MLLYRESDRGAAVVAASLLDKKLEDLVRTYFESVSSPSKGMVDSLFAPMAPLSSFSAKIHLCFLMGLLDKEQLHDLDLVRKLRNDFAHSSGEADFTDPAITNRMRELIYAVWIRDSLRVYSVSKKGAGKASRPSDLELHKRGFIKAGKVLFAAAIQFLMADLQLTIKLVQKNKGKILPLSVNNTVLRSPHTDQKEEAVRRALQRVVEILALDEMHPTGNSASIERESR